MSYKLLFIYFNLLLIATAEPPVEQFFIEENGIRCALFDLSADISVEYETTEGKSSTTLNFSKSTASGRCSYSANDNFVLFNITLSNQEHIYFRFVNQSDVVQIEAIGLDYTTPNSDFQFAKNNGTVSMYSNPQFALSSTNNYYKCHSTLRFDLNNTATLNIYKMKIKVFNVVNNSFGNQSDECSQDFISTTSTGSPETTSAISTTHKYSTATTRSDTTVHTTSTSDHSTISTHQTSTTHIHSTSTMHIHSTSPMHTTVKPTNNLKFAISDNKTGVYCLLINSQLTLDIKYPTQDNQIKTSSFLIESNATFNGTCSPLVNSISIDWVSGLRITFSFMKKDKSSTLNSITLEYTMTSEYFSGNTLMNQSISATKDVNDCQVSIGNYYGCQSISYNIGNTTVILQGFQYEAFRTTKTQTFDGLKTECGVRNPLVAIIVGVVLAAFLIIVVILFFIFRFRANKRRGYEEI